MSYRSITYIEFLKETKRLAGMPEDLQALDPKLIDAASCGQRNLRAITDTLDALYQLIQSSSLPSQAEHARKVMSALTRRRDLYLARSTKKRIRYLKAKCPGLDEQTLTRLVQEKPRSAHPCLHLIAEVGTPEWLDYLSALIISGPEELVSSSAYAAQGIMLRHSNDSNQANAISRFYDSLRGAELLQSSLRGQAKAVLMQLGL